MQPCTITERLKVNVRLSLLIKCHVIGVMADNRSHELEEHVAYLDGLTGAPLSFKDLGFVRLKVKEEFLSVFLVKRDIREVGPFYNLFLSYVHSVTFVI